MDFFVTSPEINNMTSVKQLFERLKEVASERIGYCYYKYPLAGGIDQYLPSVTILDKEYGIVTFDSYEISLNAIIDIENNVWTLEETKTIESPLLRLEDYRFCLLPRYERYRELRGKIQYASFLILPLINKADFVQKFPHIDTEQILFSDYLTKNYTSFWPRESVLTDIEWNILVSISQGANNLTNYKPSSLNARYNKLGEAITNLSTRIALLDNDQHAAAIQIPEGPQRIRGMAGTGKTIILAMKAAYFHQRYPDKKVLYTFNTQSLYNQIRKLITRFYRQSEDRDPNWDNLLVLHGWGGASKEGVYFRTCLRNNVDPVKYGTVRRLPEPFAHVCDQLLEHNLKEEFDFVLMDEAQDFPPSFYRLIYQITKQPKRIIWAYDELQNLSNFEIQDTSVFGIDEQGNKLVDFSHGTYDNGIEMDFVLKKSYRNPHDVLMVAHGIGLGIYNADGPLQMIDNKDVWTSIGYELLGNLAIGSHVEITRPLGNSPNPIQQCYSGDQSCIQEYYFSSRQDEINWIASNIQNDIFNEFVPAHEILVISLNPKMARDNLLPLQKALHDKNILSMIPGHDDERDKFAESGNVTLTTVYRAKGNEAAVVYVMNFDYLYDYVEEILARNMAFTSITRAKGWCRVTGTGDRMARAIQEIDRIKQNIPSFKFIFPDMRNIHRLSTEEYARRALEQQKATQLINELLQRDEKVLQNLTYDQKRQLMERLGF